MSGPDLPATAPFLRTVHDELTVTIDGVLDLDRDVTDRRPARVVLAMPDDVADGLAHLVASLGRVADVFGGLDEIGLDLTELAQALYDAAAAGGYRCPDDRLHQPETSSA